MQHCNRLQQNCPATLCNTLQHTVTPNNTLQYTAAHYYSALNHPRMHSAIHCDALQHYVQNIAHAATRCNTIHHNATHCSALQHTVILCSTLQHTVTPFNTMCNTLQHTATHCNTLQHTATHCDATRPTTLCATCCNTLQHPATR